MMLEILSIVNTILLVLSLLSLVIVPFTNKMKYRVWQIVINSLLMFTLMWIEILKSQVVFAVIAGTLLVMNTLLLRFCYKEHMRNKLAKIETSKRVIKEFIKDIERYGSKRH